MKEKWTVIVISFAYLVLCDPHHRHRHPHHRTHPLTLTFPSLMVLIGAIEHAQHLIAGSPTRLTMYRPLRPVRFSPAKNRKETTPSTSFNANPVRLLYTLIIWSIYQRRQQRQLIIFHRAVPRSRKVAKRKPIRVKRIDTIGRMPRSWPNPARCVDESQCRARCLAVVDHRPCPR